MKTIVEITEQLDCSLVVSYSIAEPRSRSYQKESRLKKEKNKEKNRKNGHERLHN